MKKFLFGLLILWPVSSLAKEPAAIIYVLDGKVVHCKPSNSPRYMLCRPLRDLSEDELIKTLSNFLTTGWGGQYE